jgi:hypothetical protein
LPETLAFLQAQLRAGQLPDSERAERVLARLGSGELAWERVELAGYLGDPLAVALVGEEELVALASYLGEGGAVDVLLGGDAEPRDLVVWLGGVAHWGREAALRAILGATQALIDDLATRDPPTEQEDPYGEVFAERERALEGARRQVEALRRWVELQVGGRPRPVGGLWAFGDYAFLTYAVEDLVRLARAPDRARVKEQLLSWATSLSEAPLAPAVLRAGVRAAVPWALGET